jgi:hypothetical protein
VRATIYDATGPRWVRLVLPAMGVLGVALSLAWWRADGPPLGPDLFLGFALFLTAPLLLGRHAARAADLVTLPGRVVVRHAGILSQTIHAREIAGASTAAASASSPGRYTIALERTDRDTPTILELAQEADLKTVRDALGVGHHGFGALGFTTVARPVDRALDALRLSAAAASLFVAACTLLAVDPEPLVTIAAVYLVFPFPVALFWVWVRARETRQAGRVWLTPQEVFLQDGRGVWERVPFSEIASARLEDGWLVLEREGKKPACTRMREVRHARRGMTRAEAAHLMAQIEAAVRRARGEVHPEPGTSAAAAALGRGDGEAARAWLERLEATARQVTTRASYRGAPMSEHELWAALENHDADADVRAAAARVLTRVVPPEAHSRIESVLLAMRDGLAKKKMRVAVEPDLERACSELERLERCAEDGEEARRSSGAGAR